MSTDPIPVNSLRRHTSPIEDALIEASSQVVRSGYFVLGPHVKEFETSFAAYCGVEHCVTLANGTDALELALRAVGVDAGDKVCVSANAAMYGTTAVLACDAEPVFVDVSGDHATMDPDALSNVLQDTPIKAVIVTHLYGRLAQMEKITALCAAKDVKLVEDCAQAHGAMDAQARKAGSFGDVATFSFYPTKNLGALGDGGAAVTRDAHIANRMRQLRQYGWSSKYTNELARGRNSRLDEIQASMLLVMLPLLDGWNSARRSIANRYSSEIRNPKIVAPPTAGNEYVAHLYVVQCSERSKLQEHLTALGIQSEVHYPMPDHHQPCHSGRYAGISLPITEKLCETVVTLPCFPEMTDAEVQRVIDACNQF